MNVFFIDWVGIGFSNNGEPTNADLCVLWSDWKGEIKFEVIFRLGSLILLNMCSHLFSMLLWQPRNRPLIMLASRGT